MADSEEETVVRRGVIEFKSIGKITDCEEIKRKRAGVNQLRIKLSSMDFLPHCTLFIESVTFSVCAGSRIRGEASICNSFFLRR